MWGLPEQARTRQPAARFIPTRVGNTCRASSRPRRRPVHPHACGEYCPDGQPRRSVNGSSPRVWGIQGGFLDIVKIGRFIPTHVGNTAPDGGSAARPPVHPHACGEYFCCHVRAAASIGSSPRMWGIRGLSYLDAHIERFIPTHVGNTLQEDARNNRLLA